jgi:hypothetical protein
MHDRASDLLRIALPRTPVNKALAFCIRARVPARSPQSGRRGSAFHAERVLVGRHSPTPTTCRCPSVCWAAERDCPRASLLP